MVDTLTVDSRVALTKIISIFRLRDESSSGGLGGRLMCGIKTPQQECAKDAGRGGGLFAGYYSNIFSYNFRTSL